MIHEIHQIIVVARSTHDNVDDETPRNGIFREEKVVLRVGLKKIALFRVFRDERVLRVDSRGNGNNVLVIVVDATTDEKDPIFQRSGLDSAR